jgi:hypothetical protein
MPCGNGTTAVARLVHDFKAVMMHTQQRPGNRSRFVTGTHNSEGGSPMKRVLAGTFMAATFAVGLAAQTPQNPPSTPPSQPPAQEARESASKNITVTGCLKAGETPDSFMLSDLKFGRAGDKAVGTSGAAPAAIASATSLKLTGSPAGMKLSEHVGHTVEVTGSVSEKSASAPGAPADPAARPSSSATPALDVRTVKMVSATCTP